MPWAAWIGAALAFWSVSHLGIPRSLLYLVTPGTNILRQELYGLFAFLLMLPAVFGPQDRSLVRRFLRCWPVASIGVISYGIYLWHLNLTDEMVSWTGYRSGAMPYWILVLSVLAISIAFASVSYFGLERPLLRIKDHLGWWNRVGGTTGSGAPSGATEPSSDVSPTLPVAERADAGGA
jgi:peptidoglycan/LPS O-acetylase OafA/YrhL